LAEILFETKDFEGATSHYRWIVDHGVAQRTAMIDKKRAVNDRAEAALVEEARLKSCSLTLRVAHAQGHVPERF